MKNQLDEIKLENVTRRNPLPSYGWRRFSTACLEKLHELKETITADLASRFGGTLRPEIVRQVVNEADALAVSTGFPALFLPALAEEKVILASRWPTKRRIIRERSPSVAA